MMPIELFTEMYNETMKKEEQLSEEILTTTYNMVAGMFFNMCNVIPNFDLDQYGRIELLDEKKA